MVKMLPPPLKALVWTLNKFKFDKRMAMKVRTTMIETAPTPAPLERKGCLRKLQAAVSVVSHVTVDDHVIISVVASFIPF